MTEEVRITKLTRGDKRGKLEISTLDKPLIVSHEMILQHRLVEGVVITPAQLELLRFESELYLCDDTAARLLAVRQHSVGELKAKLTQRKFSVEVARRVIKKYIDRGVLDDNHYALKLAEKLVAERPCGRSYLVAHLRRKKISRELAEETADMVLTGREEIALAMASLEKRWAHLGQFELEVARNKSYNYLSRRGFSYPAARAAFEKLVNRQKED
ncbi:MAG: recombination regulator RecX [candidate division Zixibacteria bacterium]|nr:recombination regulator RecX [candidate division Zixibacteria bacterium]